MHNSQSEIKCHYHWTLSRTTIFPTEQINYKITYVCQYSNKE